MTLSQEIIILFLKILYIIPKGATIKAAPPLILYAHTPLSMPENMLSVRTND